VKVKLVKGIAHPPIHAGNMEIGQIGYYAGEATYLLRVYNGVVNLSDPSVTYRPDATLLVHVQPIGTKLELEITR